MQKRKLNNQGFGLVGILVVVLVLVAIGGAGYLVWQKNHDTKKSTTQTSNTDSAGNKSDSKSTTADPYEGWKTYTLASRGLTFKYPSSWVVPTGGEDASGIEIHSPTNNGYYFSLALLSGSGDGVNQNFLGTASGSTILTLAVSGASSPLYVDAQTSGEKINGIGLATSAGGDSTSFGILDNGGKGANNVTMVANLIPEGSGSGVNNAYTLQTYEAQAEYKTLLDIFKSLSYKD